MSIRIDPIKIEKRPRFYPGPLSYILYTNAEKRPLEVYSFTFTKRSVPI